MRVAVFLRIIRIEAHMRGCAQDSAFILFRRPVIACAPGVNVDEIEVSNAPPGECRPEIWMSFDSLLGGEELLQHDGGLNAGYVFPRCDLALAEIDDGLVRCACRA